MDREEQKKKVQEKLRALLQAHPELANRMGARAAGGPTMNLPEVTSGPAMPGMAMQNLPTVTRSGQPQASAADMMTPLGGPVGQSGNNNWLRGEMNASMAPHKAAALGGNGAAGGTPPPGGGGMYQRSPGGPVYDPSMVNQWTDANLGTEGKDGTKVTLGGAQANLQKTYDDVSQPYKRNALDYILGGAGLLAGVVGSTKKRGDSMNGPLALASMLGMGHYADGPARDAARKKNKWDQAQNLYDSALQSANATFRYTQTKDPVNAYDKYLGGHDPSGGKTGGRTGGKTSSQSGDIRYDTDRERFRQQICGAAGWPADGVTLNDQHYNCSQLPWMEDEDLENALTNNQTRYDRILGGGKLPSGEIYGDKEDGGVVQYDSPSDADKRRAADDAWVARNNVHVGGFKDTMKRENPDLFAKYEDAGWPEVSDFPKMLGTDWADTQGGTDVPLLGNFGGNKKIIPELSQAVDSVMFYDQDEPRADWKEDYLMYDDVFVNPWSYGLDKASQSKIRRQVKDLGKSPLLLAQEYGFDSVEELWEDIRGQLKSGEITPAKYYEIGVQLGMDKAIKGKYENSLGQ